MANDAEGDRSRLISVILPNRNHGIYLRTSIPRLLGQTWRELEILVVDDASSDDSCAVVEAFAARDPRVRLLRLERNLGVARALMRGAEHVRGSYIYCAAADDFVVPHFFERCVPLLIRCPSTAFCFSDPTERYENGLQRTFPLFLSESARCYTADELERELRVNYFYFGSNTIIYRRSFFMEAGGYREDLHWLSDWFVNNVLALRHGACYVPEPMTEFCIREDSYSAVSLRRTTQQRELFWRVLALLREPQFSDVRPRFVRAAILPEYRLRDLNWLVCANGDTRYVSVRLLARILARGLWHYARGFAPAGLRRLLRKMASQATA